MRILLDMDNTMNRLWENYIRYLNDIYKTDFYCYIEDLEDYNITKNLILPEGLEDHSVMKKIFQTPGFWTSIEIFDDNTAQVIEEMYRKYDVYICTTPWNDYIDCHSEKIRWVKNHLPFFDIDKMIFIKNKNMINSDLIIEDSPENLKAHMYNQIIMDFPYNRHIEGYRVFNWEEIHKVMKEYFYL